MSRRDDIKLQEFSIVLRIAYACTYHSEVIELTLCLIVLLYVFRNAEKISTVGRIKSSRH